MAATTASTVIRLSIWSQALVVVALAPACGNSTRSQAPDGDGGDPGSAGGGAGGQAGAAPAEFSECFQAEGAGLGSNDLSCNDVCSRAGAVCSPSGCENMSTVAVFASMQAACANGAVAPGTCSNDSYQQDRTCADHTIEGQGLQLEWDCTTPVPIGSSAHPGVLWDRARCCCLG